MAMINPTGRAAYEPNSWDQPDGGPREDPERGYTTYPRAEAGETRRIRSASFADHHSQARQFWLSQTPVEQAHIVEAFTFELSKVETERIRVRMVANLRNVDDGLAQAVADGLGFVVLPDPLPVTVERNDDLAPSPALSILLNGPTSFAGRKVGALVTDGTDLDLLASLRTALEEEGALLELVAPTIAGIHGPDDTTIEADQNVAGGPSVLYDAVVLLPSADGVAGLAGDPAARDFVTDAVAHGKFVGYVAAAQPLLSAAGVEVDGGFVDLADGVDGFVGACRGVRFWERTPAGKVVV
jgi:catalase